MVKAMVAMSHHLTKGQENDLESKHKVNEIIYLGNEDQMKFSNVDPEIDANELEVIAKEIASNIYKALNGAGILIIQGEAGLCFKIMKNLKDSNISCVYATTKRTSVESINEETGEVIKTLKFNHIQFRKY